MQRRSKRLLLALGLVVAGCAEQQPAVNRVEAYALPKSLFTGEWFNQQTVVDVPGAKTVTFEGETAFMGTHRIRWDIQESYLYARMAYEKVQGGKNTSQDTGAYKGEIVGAWRIESHFDIKRGYNPTTGEENNVLEENASDCKWYDCKYLRVDWSKNYAVDFYFLDYDESLKKEPIPFYVQDRTDPKFKPVFDELGGYIDITMAMAVAPGSEYYPWWGGNIPTCWLYASQDASCNTEIIKIRNSFWRRDPNRDYEPRKNKGEKDNWFGYFNTERWTWYAEQGLTYPTKKQYLQRHNLWEKSHSETACTADASCPTSKGSRCDTDMPFHKYDVATDSDYDGLPDSYEATVEGLSTTSADSDGDGLIDSQDDANGNGKRELEDFYAWDEKGLEYRCTLPMSEREPLPLVYFNTGNIPRSMVCDEHGNDPKKDSDPTPCKYTWTADATVRETKWSAMHATHHTYEEMLWRTFLRGAYGWTVGELDTWLNTRDAAKVSKKTILEKFGDATNGYYAFAFCPNNPIQKDDPWPCRFPRHSYRQAKELMQQGLTYNHLSYATAKKELAAKRSLDQTAPVIRVGDIRYSYVHYAKDYSAVSPLGYGPSAFDPRTGEILAGFANFYSYTDYYATYMQEIVQLLNGQTKPTDYINGVDLSKWMKRLNLDEDTKEAGRAVSPSELQAMYDATEQPWMSKIPRLGTSAAFASMKDSYGNALSNRQLKTKLLGMMSKSGMFDITKTPPGMKAVAGTSLENQLLDHEVLMASGYLPSKTGMVSAKSLSTDQLKKASLARGGFLELLKQREQWRMQVAEKKRITFADMVDEGAASLAYRLRNEPSDKVWALARKLITYPVVVHEMGHTVGLMHNFGGSDDALNFGKEYWQLRTNDWKEVNVCDAKSPAADELCPFFIRPKSSYQLGKDARNTKSGLRGLEDYAYASIMDYDRWPTLMGSGLGRYDKAAFMYGYADKVEVFKDPGSVPDGTKGMDVFNDWWDTDGSVLILYSTRAQSFHYTQWYTQMKSKLFDENNRELVSYEDVNHETNQYGREDGWYYKKGNTRMVRVPYIYCSHSSANISESCLTWDWGADQYERMAMHVNDWDTWYVINAFTRNRYYWSPEKYVSRRYDRFYERLKNFNNLYALYQGLFHQWYDKSQIQSFFTDGVNGWGAYTVAMNDAFNAAMRTLAMPDIKGFKDKAAEPDGQSIYSESVWSNEELFQTDLNTGRYFTTSWYDANYSQKCGYEWHECLHHIGFYLDKVMALYVLSDPQTYFVARDTAEDIRQWRISFFDNYTTQIVDFFGSMLSEDYDSIAPWYDPTKPKDGVVREGQTKWVNGVAWRNYATPAQDAKKPAQGGPIEAATRFTLQVYAAVLGMMRFHQNFDNDFAERTRMWKKGKGTGWTIKQTDKIDGVAEFDDPYTGTTYTGVKYKDKKGIAQRMIGHANKLKGRTDYCTTAPTPPAPAPDDVCVSGLSTSDKTRAETALYEYRQLMDIVIQASTIYDEYSGKNWSSDPYDP